MASYSLVYVCDGCEEQVTPQTHKEKIRTMPCFHTLCNKCILIACGGGKPRCPRCKKEWDLSEMRRFTCCAVCKYFRKQAVSFCVDCNKDMCRECELKHTENTMGENHQILVIPQGFGKEISDKVREAGVEGDPNLKADLSTIDDIERSSNHLSDNTSLNVPGVTCTSKLHLDTTDVFQLMREKKAMVNMMVEDTENQLSFFSEILDANPDLKENMEATVDEFVQEGIDQVQNIVTTSPWDSSLQYEVCVTGKPMDPFCQPEVFVKTKTIPRVNFKDTLNLKFRLNSSRPIVGNARRVYKVQNRVLVSTWDSLQLFTLDCQPLGKTVWNSMFEASCVVPIDTSIWVVSDYEKGCYMINRAGMVMQKLCAGCFSDVDVYDDKLYVLEYKQCLVKIFQFNPAKQQWLIIQDVSLKYENVSSGDTVRAFDDRLHVCSAQNHCVFIYSLSSNKFRQVGRYGKATYDTREEQLLFYPRITMADFFGNSLVADSWNKRLLNLDDDDKFGQLDLGGDEGEIWDIYYEHSHHHLWAISFVDGQYRLLHFIGS